MICCDASADQVQVSALSGGSLPLIFCIHVRPGPIYWGVFTLQKNYKVMVFYM